MMRHVRKAMKRNGQMLNRRVQGRDPHHRGSTPLHSMSEAEIMKEIPALGFRRDRAIDSVPSQHVFVFKKTEAD